MKRAGFALLILLATLLGGEDGRTADGREPIFDRDWIAFSTTAMGVTGDARLTPDSITFDRRATFKLRFIVEVVPQRPESYLRTIPSFSLYQVVDPKPLEIHNGNHLCGHPKYNRNIPLPRYMAIGLDSSGRQEDELVVMVFTSEAPPPDINDGVKGLCGSYGYFSEKRPTP